MNTESPIISETQPVKPRRGRPPKYSPEERKQKHRESIDKWRQENKEQLQQVSKEYYNNHHKEVMQLQGDYLNRSRYALRLIKDIYNDQESLSHLPSTIQNRLRMLIEQKQIIST